MCLAWIFAKKSKKVCPSWPQGQKKTIIRSKIQLDMAFFWPCGHEGQTFFDLLAKIQARRIKRSNDWGKTLFFKKTWCCLLLN